MLSMMADNRAALTRDITTMVYYYNGGIPYNDAWMMSSFERTTAIEVVDKHYQKMSGKDRLI